MKNREKQNRKTVIYSDGSVKFEYPETATNAERGFTPAGGSVLNFDVLRKMSPSRSSRIASDQDKAFVSYVKHYNDKRKTGDKYSLKSVMGFALSKFYIPTRYAKMLINIYL